MVETSAGAAQRNAGTNLEEFKKNLLLIETRLNASGTVDMWLLGTSSIDEFHFTSAYWVLQ